jgi:PAS domain S-box-containing protein
MLQRFVSGRLMPELDASHLDLLGELAEVGFFQVDAERNVVALSPALERITGFTAAEVIGRPCIALIRCSDCLQSCGVFKHGRVDSARLRIYRKDGTEVEVVRSGAVLRNGAGKPVGALETVRLPTDAAACGTIVPAELDVLLRGLGRLFIAADRDFRIRAFSPSLPALIGWSDEQLRAATLVDLFGEELFGPPGPLRASVLAGKRKEGWQAALPTAAGGRMGVSISIGPIAEEDRCGHEDIRVVLMIRPETDGSPVEECRVFHGIVGRSAAMQRIFRLIDLLREHDATVLITGESGTGKELIARAVHATSNRATGPFIAVNCAALPADLLESELFGHVRGAFTGAVRDRAGRFELANGGTIFLDEIGDLAPALQAKILRVLQERTYERVGDTRTRTVDVRVIAATHMNVGKAVAEHQFREDLYYRLRVIPIELPPLRARREDIPELVETLLQRIGRRHGRSLRLASTVSRVLLAYDWPGNVRELENTLEYAVTVCSGQTIHVEDLPGEIRRPIVSSPRSDNTITPLYPQTAAPCEALSEEARHIQEALIQARFDRTSAALLLGMSRTTLWRKMREHRL